MVKRAMSVELRVATHLAKKRQQEVPIDERREQFKKDLNAIFEEPLKNFCELSFKVREEIFETATMIRVITWKGKPSPSFSCYGVVNSENSDDVAAKETSSEIQQMLILSKRGWNDDLCYDCGDKIRFCQEVRCALVGCPTCFGAILNKCPKCKNVGCVRHTTLEKCHACDIHLCWECCDVCACGHNIICGDCEKCEDCEE